VLVGAAVLVAGQIGGHQNAAVAAGGWVAGGLLGLVLLRSCLRPPRWRGTLRWFGGDRRRHHLTVDALSAAVAPLVVVSLVAAIVSPAVVGSLRGASTLMSPVNVAIAAISLGAVAEIRRRPWDGAVRFMVALSVGLAACALVWGLVVWAMPASVGSFLLGDTWSSARAVLPFTTAEFIALAVWNGAVALLRASGRTRVSAGLRVCYLMIAVVAATGAAWTTGTARGVQLGLAASAALIAIATWATVLRQGQIEAAVSVVGSKSG